MRATQRSTQSAVERQERASLHVHGDSTRCDACGEGRCFKARNIANGDFVHAKAGRDAARGARGASMSGGEVDVCLEGLHV